jgi:hypothetical protein
MATPGAGGGQPGGGAFADQVTFELGQGREHVEHQLAAGVVVSMASWRLRNPMPRPARPVTVSTSWRRERPRRSSFHPTRGSPGRSWSGSWARVGRSRGAAGGLGEPPIAAGVLEGVDLELGVLVVETRA